MPASESCPTVGHRRDASGAALPPGPTRFRSPARTGRVDTVAQPASDPRGGRFSSCPAFCDMPPGPDNMFFLVAGVIHEIMLLSPQVAQRRTFDVHSVAVMPLQRQKNGNLVEDPQ